MLPGGPPIESRSKTYTRKLSRCLSMKTLELFYRKLKE